MSHGIPWDSIGYRQHSCHIRRGPQLLPHGKASINSECFQRSSLLLFSLLLFPLPNALALNAVNSPSLPNAML
eukprot:1392558-Amorphochlora_amoeboformis.AAC.1